MHSSTRPRTPSLPRRIERLLPNSIRRRQIVSGAYAYHVMEQGEGPTVVLLHGNPTWSFLYRKVFGELAGENLRLIAPDLLGLGLSDRPKRPQQEHTLHGHGRRLAKLLTTLGVKDPIFVVQDWGGPIGLLAASLGVGLSGLVVMNTALSPPHARTRPTPFHRFSQLPVLSDLAFRALQFPQIALGRAQGDPTSISGDVARAYRYPLRNPLQNHAPLLLARMVPSHLDHPSVPFLNRVKHFTENWHGPAHIVWGNNDPILGRAKKGVCALLPQAAITETDAGHFLQEEVPDQIASAIVSVSRQAV